MTFKILLSIQSDWFIIDYADPMTTPKALALALALGLLVGCAGSSDRVKKSGQDDAEWDETSIKSGFREFLDAALLLETIDHPSKSFTEDLFVESPSGVHFSRIRYTQYRAGYGVQTYSASASVKWYAQHNPMFMKRVFKPGASKKAPAGLGEFDTVRLEASEKMPFLSCLVFGTVIDRGSRLLEGFFCAEGKPLPDPEIEEFLQTLDVRRSVS